MGKKKVIKCLIWGVSVDTLKPGMYNVGDFAANIRNLYLNQFRMTLIDDLKEVSFQKVSGLLLGGLSPQGTKGRVHVKPSFEISIPEDCIDWNIKESGVKEKPILILKNEGHTFIDTPVAYFETMPLEIKEMWNNPDELFASKISYDKEFEKQVFPDVEFIQDNITTIPDLPPCLRCSRQAASGR